MPELAKNRSMKALDVPACGRTRRCRQPFGVVLLYERRERVATDLQAIDDGFGFLIVRDSDSEIDVLGEPGLSAERHRQAADDGPAGADGIEVLSCLHENRVDGLHSALPARRQPQAIARLAAWLAQPRLHPGLNLLI